VTGWSRSDGEQSGQGWAQAVLIEVPGVPVRLDLDLGTAPPETRWRYLVGFADGIMLAVREAQAGDG